MIDIKMKNLIAFPPQRHDGTLDLKLHSLIYISELQTQADVTIVKLLLEDRYRRKQQHQKLGWYFTVLKA